MTFTVGDSRFLRDLVNVQPFYLEEEARQLAIQRNREYYSGEQYVKLTDRLREFLQDTPGAADSEALRLNVVRTVVNAVVERLGVRGFISPLPEAARIAGDIWFGSMGIAEDELFINVIRDGEAFLIIEWDSVKQMPRLTVNPRYVDAAYEDNGTRLTRADDSFGWTSQAYTGLGYGCIAHYKTDSDPLPEYIVKRFTEEYEDARGRPAVRQRMTKYYDDRVEKYVQVNGQWQPITDAENEPWPIELKLPDGRPIGNVAIHVKNLGMQCEANEAIGLQNAINKSLIDAMAASDLTAFRVFFAAGWIPTKDGLPPNGGSNQLSIEPGQILGSSSVDAKLTAIDGADITMMLDTVSRLIQYVAMVTDTPVSRFNVTGNIASSETIKAQEGPLVAKVRKRQGTIGSAISQTMQVANRMHLVYSTEPLDPEIADAGLFTEWMPAETEDMKTELETAKLKLEIGISRQQIYRELGYSEDEIAQIIAETSAA